ncbi:hypothetical protein PC41400_25020 [Paenibacillus chitinolyticus]|uniref:Uncharacterized protein n=1 Tax=Paenibacillus chitinolyticus TaxID=79263 RepID=A0A410X2C3_9BACL|nr:hypothetical protein [Paenibacillus chitinolyticus]MCY9593598.1 hypothetical protein [Paenibacillus chitinolyticus]MCY9597569.1 hypothetical protein [Paenibacillus chitinolyticus]QAV20766.1 hypothetical protein PC41400_25020 [Paenibacillus chitinolyticus]
MATILDYQTNDALIGGGSLPFPVTNPLLGGVELEVATINLTPADTTNLLRFEGTIGWQPDLLLATPLLPILQVRIRVGSPTGTVIYETDDSALIGTGVLTTITDNILTVSFQHSIQASVVPTGSQPYFLTVAVRGLGSISIRGPIHFGAFVIAP